MTIFQTQLLSELGAGADGEPISQSKLVYLQERLRGRFFDFLIGKFEDARKSGLTQAKLARRIRKSPEVINRWLSAPANLTLDSMSDLFAGISSAEPEFSTSSLLGRSPVNYDDIASIDDDSLPEQKSSQISALDKPQGERSGRIAAIEDALEQ